VEEGKAAEPAPFVATGRLASERYGALLPGFAPPTRQQTLLSPRAVRRRKQEQALVHNAKNTQGVAFNMKAGLELFELMDLDKSDRITRNEMFHQLDTKLDLRRRLVDSDDEVLQQLLEPETRANVFEDLDTSGDGIIDRQEWKEFLELLRDERAHYLKQHALLRSRPLAYWARGTGDVHSDVCGLVEKGTVPQGYFDDLSYYIHNHHPILSICYADEDHPLTPFSRIVLEIEVLLITLLGAGVAYAIIRGSGVSREDEEDAEPDALGAVYGFTLLFITIPSMTVATLLMYLQACPCLIYKRSSEKRDFLRSAALFVGKTISVTLLLLAAGAAAFGVILGLQNRGQDFLIWWVAGRAQAYLLWFGWLLFREFNLLFEVELLGIGRWLTERRKTLEGTGRIYDNVTVTAQEEAEFQGSLVLATRV